MAELKIHEEPSFPSKRKPEDTEEFPKKAPKLATLDHNETEEAIPNSNNNNNSEVPSTNCSSLTEEKNTESDVATKEGANVDSELQNDDEHKENDDDEDEDADEYEYEDEDEDEDEDDEDSNGEAEVDQKGKGVLRDDKGKGKLIEEDDDDDSDDDDDNSGDDDEIISGGDSDFSDDPLAEVDLNNILPSRTRRRTPHPGLHIASDTGNADDDDDDSDA